MFPTWCPVCSTRHTPGRQDCPGELVATEPERHGWRVNVETPGGIDVYGVLVAPAGNGWRARILTYPNVLWVTPGGKLSMKFVGSTAREAESEAVAFIRQHCVQRGFKVLGGVPRVVPGKIEGESVASAAKPAPRKIRFLPVRFGVSSPTEAGGTGNLSETGLFVITSFPVDAGTRLRLLLDLSRETLRLDGEVRWMRGEHHVGRAPGMGVQLARPPGSYRRYVRALD